MGSPLCSASQGNAALGKAQENGGGKGVCVSVAVLLLCQGLLNMELKPLLIPESLLVELGRNRWIQTDGEKRKQQGNTKA